NTNLRPAMLKRIRSIVSSRNNQCEITVDEADLAADWRPCEAVGERFGPVVHHHDGRQPATPSHIVPATANAETCKAMPVKVQRELMLALQVDLSGGVRPCAM